jgi:hypothetical protein
MLSCTPSQLEEESGATLDWLLAIDEVFITTENKIRNGEA